jgi:hypothetical protein
MIWPDTSVGLTRTRCIPLTIPGYASIPAYFVAPARPTDAFLHKSFLDAAVYFFFPFSLHFLSFFSPFSLLLFFFFLLSFFLSFFLLGQPIEPYVHTRNPFAPLIPGPLTLTGARLIPPRTHFNFQSVFLWPLTHIILTLSSGLFKIRIIEEEKKAREGGFMYNSAPLLVPSLFTVFSYLFSIRCFFFRFVSFLILNDQLISERLQFYKSMLTGKQLSSSNENSYANSQCLLSHMHTCFISLRGRS